MIKLKLDEFEFCGYYDELVKKVSDKLGVSFTWVSSRSKITFVNKEKTIGLITPKTQEFKEVGIYKQFWFSLHPYQIEFLKSFEKSYVAFYCASIDQVLLFKNREILPFLNNVSVIKKDNHLMIYFLKDGRKYFIKQPRIDTKRNDDVTKYLM